MVSYPIHIKRHYYRGAKPNLQRQSAHLNERIGDLERKINALLKTQTEPIKMYDWDDISRATGHDVSFIQEHGFSIAGGSGGFHAIRHDLTYEQAQAMMAQQKEPK